MGFAIFILQPSLHTPEEFIRLVLSEVESLGVEVKDLIADLDREPEFEDEIFWECCIRLSEIFWECCMRLSDAGYQNVCQDDTFLVWPKGSELPKEWRE